MPAAFNIAPYRCGIKGETILIMRNKGNMELLAPAGDMICLHAAVTAGADAVYLGAEAFNARRSAGNFTLENLEQACEYAHLRGVSIYLTVNTVILPHEMGQALELVRQAYRRGVDAFIVQDIGLAAELKRTLPQARLHISTQMNTHSAAGLAAAAALGADRVTFARELSLVEVKQLSDAAREAGMETEIFGHGALCICYSGQCFMSSLIGGRSANRGMCAQACRLPYTLHNKAQRKNLEAPGEHLLSPKDLCTIDIIPALLDAGVSSLKIEGRMKSPEYVHSVIGVYRAVIDRALAARGAASGQSASAAAPSSAAAGATRSTAATVEEHRVLAEAFSRGFTTAYLFNESGNDIMSYKRPNNRGVFVGRVTAVRDGIVTVEMESSVGAGDVLEFWTNRGHFAQTVAGSDEIKGKQLKMAIAKRVGKGDRVFRVREAAAAFIDDEREPRIPLTGRAVLKKGSPLTLSFTAPDGTTVEATGPLVEAARTKAVTADEIHDHIDRMGSTPFCLASDDALVIDADGDVGIGFSQIHKLRAQALDDLAARMAKKAKGDRTLPRSEPRREYPVLHERGCAVAVMTSNPACARAAKRAGADILYVSSLNYKRGTAVVGGQLTPTVEQAGYPKQAIIALPAISHDPIDSSREAIFGFDSSAYIKEGKSLLADNLGQLVEAAAQGAIVEAGPHIPVLNRLALEEALDLGAKRVWLSPELSLEQIEQLGKDKPVSLGLTIMGANELMVTEHCLLMSQGPCNRECAECVRRKSPHYLKDRKGYEMPVITDCCGRSHLYNAVALDAAHLMPDLIKAGIDAVMVDTTLMNVEETSEAVHRAVHARDLALKSGDSISKVEGATTGHLFRGVS